MWIKMADKSQINRARAAGQWQKLENDSLVLLPRRKKKEMKGKTNINEK